MVTSVVLPWRVWGPDYGKWELQEASIKVKGGCSVWLATLPCDMLPSHMFLGYIESVSCESSKDKVSQVTSIQTCMNSPSTKMKDMEYTRTRRTSVCPFILYCTASQVFCRLSIEARYKVVQMNYVGDLLRYAPPSQNTWVTLLSRVIRHLINSPSALAKQVCSY